MAASASPSVVAQVDSYTHYEAPQTHAVEVAAAGDRLYVVDTADSRLVVYSLQDPRRPALLREVRVGQGPVAVRERTRDEVWVVDFASDAISVVSVSAGVVVATIPTRDEPGDVVFAGQPVRAFVSTGTDRIVQVFDPVARTLVDEIPVFCDDPRSLEVSEDGRRVWVASHRSGNGTTIVGADAAPPPPPPTNPALPPAPPQGLVVAHDDPAWSSEHGIFLPDFDVFEIDAASRTTVRRFTGAGTILFDLSLRPGHDELFVANTEARNLVRFVTALRGHAVDNRLTRIDLSSGSVQPIDLNPGLDYSTLPNPTARATALAQPTDTAWAPDGSLAYVASFGTDRIGVLAPDGRVVGRIDVGPTSDGSPDPRRKRGPRALAHHPTADVLYVGNRISNSLTVVDTAARRVLAEIGRPLDPTPDAVREGRGFLYDALLSANGTVSCASCHVDGTTDNLSWDLGNPAGDPERGVGSDGRAFDLHPMKGPMVTQTFQGLAGVAPFHWRGDRATLQDFNGTFDDLMGAQEIPAPDMDTFAAFLESITFMPNPRQLLDRSLATTPVGASAAEGEALYLGGGGNPVNCVNCHALTTGTDSRIFGGRVLQTDQPFKVAQLRNMYKRDGRTDVGAARGARTAGFGYTHDGDVDSVFDFLGLPVFRGLSTNPAARAQIAAFVMSFDNGTAPTVGHRVTVDLGNVTDRALRSEIGTMMVRAAAGDCDLVVHGLWRGERVGMLFDPTTGRFAADRGGEASRSIDDLDAEVRAGTAILTFQGVFPGDGRRLGLDRDLDGILDRDALPQVYGAPSPVVCSGEFAITGSGPARLGDATFGVVVSGAGASARDAALMVGFAPTSLPFSGLEFLIDPLGSFTVPFRIDGRGEGVLPAGIPDDPALVGGSLFFQAAVPAPCGTFSTRFSAGLEVTIR